MRIREFSAEMYDHPDSINVWLESVKVVDIKYSCCCDAMGKKVTTCMLVMYEPKGHNVD